MKKILFLSFYFTSPWFIIRVLYGINPQRYSSWTMLGAMVFGVMAYNWFVWQFVLSARPKFLDCLIGLDKIYRLHGIMALVSIGLAFSHRLIFEAIYKENLATVLGDIALIIYGIVSLIAVILMTKSRWIRLKPFKEISRLLDKFKIFRYEHHKVFHNLTIVALILMEIHVLMTVSARTYKAVFAIYMVYFLSAVIFYVYHKVLRFWLLEEKACEVEAVQQEATHVWTIRIRPLGHRIKYKPGQFGFFRIYVGGSKEEHPFSFTSTPTNDGHISITVKALGDFTSGLNKLRPKDQVVIDGPYGDFSYLNHPKELETVFIAGGVGITPVMSMIRHMVDVEPMRKVTLLWGIQTDQDYLFEMELKRLIETMPNLKVVPVISNDSSYLGEKGFIDYEKLVKYVGKSEKVKRKIGYYICGPSILMKNSIRNLKAMGISHLRIHHESFSL